jgi:hypothetical protein
MFPAPSEAIAKTLPLGPFVQNRSSQPSLHEVVGETLLGNAVSDMNRGEPSGLAAIRKPLGSKLPDTPRFIEPSESSAEEIGRPLGEAGTESA